MNTLPRLKPSLIKNALVMPLLGSMDSFQAGVFREDGTFVEGSLLERASPSPIFPVRKKLSGIYLFGGYLFGHFGHFLLESASRLYALLQSPGHPILFLSPNTAIHASQHAMLKHLGVDGQYVLVKDPVQVESLLFAPPASSINPPFISDAQMAALARFTVPGGTAGKVWLSRSKFNGGNVEGEEQIERSLSRLGWDILFPEELSLKDQILAVNASSVVAGFDGSAFYSCLLAKRTYGKFFIFSRRSTVPAEIPYLLGRKNIPFELYPLPVEFQSGTGASACYRLPDPLLVIDKLKELP